MRQLAFMTALGLLLLLAGSQTPLAAEYGSLQKGSVDSTGLGRRLEPDRFLTSGGIGFKAASDVKLEPKFGLSHVMHQRELGSGYDDVIHRVHAQAGGKVYLFESFYLGIASKLPIYNYEIATERTTGGPALHPATGRHDYELLRLSPNSLTWTGEMGLQLGRKVDLNLYYDQNRLKGPLQPGVTSAEEVIGTKFIFRFK